MFNLSIFDRLRHGKPKANITSISINYMGSTHQLQGMKVFDSEFELRIPFKNKTASDLPEDIKRPDLRIDDIQVQSPFKLIDVKPQLPIVVPYGESTEILLKLKAPEIAYTGPLFLNMLAKSPDSIHVSISHVLLSKDEKSYEVESSQRSMYLQKGEVFRQDVQVMSVLDKGESISRVEVNKPFSLVKTEPQLPLNCDKDSIVLSLFLKAPEFSYAGPLEVDFH